MAVVVTVAKGYELGYIWKAQGEIARQTIGGYYINAAQAGSHPAAGGDQEFSKSISVLHASLRENERRARIAGDQQAAAYWAGREERFQEILHRDTYTDQNAWAPRHVGKELRLARLGTFDAALGAIRATTETQAARKAGDHDRAGQHGTLAASYQALRDLYQQREYTLAQAKSVSLHCDHQRLG